MMWNCAEAARATNTDYDQLYRWIRMGRIQGARRCKKTGHWHVPTTVLAKPTDLDIYVPIDTLKRISYRPPTEAFRKRRKAYRAKRKAQLEAKQGQNVFPK